jgi:hypothetical protein
MFRIWEREGKTRLLFNHHMQVIVQLHVPATILLAKMSQVHNEQVAGGGPNTVLTLGLREETRAPAVNQITICFISSP